LKTSDTNFESMNLLAPLMRSLADLKYTTPTPVQAQIIPFAIAGRDILACAQTGTGKTAAFALPILDYLGRDRPQRTPKCPTALVLAPTRELAIQIAASFRSYGQYLRFSLALVYGGVGQQGQVKAMKPGVDVLVSTPGRLLDLLQQHHIDLGNVKVLVLDEADRMLDMGFLPDLRRIIAKLPWRRQSLFFSATLPASILDLANRLLIKPLQTNISPTATDVGQIRQSIRLVEQDKKFSMLHRLITGQTVKRTIVFTRTKRGANKIAQKLEKVGVRSTAIHGNKSQGARQRALENFRHDRVAVLIATDVAARGIHIANVSHVINYDMPLDPESYIHRIGRTGRAGAKGVAISLCAPDERGELRAIERLIGRRLDVEGPEKSVGRNSCSSVASSVAMTKQAQSNYSNTGSRPSKRKFPRRPHRPVDATVVRHA
jgi:ATP-dependent RNA helicase RhlE